MGRVDCATGRTRMHLEKYSTLKPRRSQNLRPSGVELSLCLSLCKQTGDDPQPGGSITQYLEGLHMLMRHLSSSAFSQCPFPSLDIPTPSTKLCNTWFTLHEMYMFKRTLSILQAKTISQIPLSPSGLVYRSI